MNNEHIREKIIKEVKLFRKGMESNNYISAGMLFDRYPITASLGTIEHVMREANVDVQTAIKALWYGDNLHYKAILRLKWLKKTEEEQQARKREKPIQTIMKEANVDRDTAISALEKHYYNRTATLEFLQKQ